MQESAARRLLRGCIIKLRQLPYLASALAMTAGLYLLAGPFRAERSHLLRLIPVWGALLAYEALVIGAIAALRRFGIRASALVFVSLFFLADVVFLGDAFASTNLNVGMALNAVAWGFALAKAELLRRACGGRASPRQAGWVAAALGFIHLFPSLIAFPAARPADFSDGYWAGVWAASAIAVPLVRGGRIGWIFAGGVTLHLVASGIVAGVDVQLRYLTPPLAAAAFIVWDRRWSPIFAAASVACSPLRHAMRDLVTTLDGAGVLLVLAAFALLAAGFLRQWLASRRNADEPGAAPGVLGRRQSTPL